MIVGFTGSQEGMTEEQKAEFLVLLRKLRPKEFHHGDCIGADSEAHDIVRMWNRKCKIVSHPPENSSKRAWKRCDEERPLLPYLQRNSRIVAESDVIVAAPKSYHEVLRSGTWATIRQARRRNMNLEIIYP